MLLRHIHLSGLTPYTHASVLQNRFVSELLAHKAKLANTCSPPPPTVITAQFHPTYTCGRREVGTVSEEQKKFLTEETPWGKAEFHEALRGGQTTFHGPGQLVAYPIVDLRRYDITPRCWVHSLESAVISTCARYGVKTTRTENPGVWLQGGDSKICALGVHLRRNVTSHGIGLNVSTRLGWFGRIVACGLEGKGTTSLAEEGADILDGDEGVRDVGNIFVQELAEGIQGIDAIEMVAETDIE